MKDSARTTLGYLSAFTLGVICMAVIFIATRSNPAPQSPVESTIKSVAQTEFVPPSKPQTFQRLRPPGPTVESTFAPLQPAEPPAAKPLPKEDAREIPPVPQPTVSEVQQIAVPIADSSRSTASIISAPGGRISGRVRLRGNPPAEKFLPLDPYCAAQYTAPPKTHLYVTGKDRGLTDVIVTLSDEIQRQGGAFPKTPLLLREIGCQIEPYISAIQTGQTVSVENRDKTLHKLRVTSANNGEFNFTQLPGKPGAEILLKHSELFVRFACEVHPWEFAYVSAVAHPFFAVTDRNGDFVIPNVPPGKYTVEAHHRKAGDTGKQIEVQANRGTTVELFLDVPTS